MHDGLTYECKSETNMAKTKRYGERFMASSSKEDTGVTSEAELSLNKEIVGTLFWGACMHSYRKAHPKHPRRSV